MNEHETVTFKTLPNRHYSSLIGFSVYLEGPETSRHVGTFALSSALSGEERRTIGMQLARLVEGKDPITGELP